MECSTGSTARKSVRENGGGWVHSLQGKTAQTNAKISSSSISSAVAIERSDMFFVFTVERATTEIKCWQWKFIRETFQQSGWWRIGKAVQFSSETRSESQSIGAVLAQPIQLAT